MAILVTGAHGGVAQAVLDRIRQYYSNEEIVLLGRRDDLGYLRCDLTNKSDVKDVLSEIQPRLIFHFAGSATNTLEVDYSNNVVSSKNIYDAIVELSINPRIFSMGSAAEYGKVNESDNPINERCHTFPVSFYGMTKLMQTQISQYYARTHGLNIVTGRMFNLKARGLSDRLFVGRLQQQIEKYIKGEISSLTFGNLKSQRDYISASGAAELIILIAEKGSSGEIYNIGSGQAIYMEELLKEVLEENGLDMSVVGKTDPTLLRSHAHEIPIIYADISKALELRG